MISIVDQWLPIMPPSGFGTSSRVSKNDFVVRGKNFVAAAYVK